MKDVLLGVFWIGGCLSAVYNFFGTIQVVILSLHHNEDESVIAHVPEFIGTVLFLWGFAFVVAFLGSLSGSGSGDDSSGSSGASGSLNVCGYCRGPHSTSYHAGR